MSFTKSFPVSFQHVMAHALGKFVFNEKDCARLFLLQQHGFLFVVCADNRFDPRIERTGDFEHLPHVKGVGCGNDKYAGASDVGLNQYGWVRGVSEDCRNPERPQTLDELTVLLCHDERNISFGETFADVLRQRKWHHVVLPMVAMSDETYDTDNGRWRRRKDELLRPDAFDPEDLADLKANTHNPRRPHRGVEGRAAVLPSIA